MRVNLMTSQHHNDLGVNDNDLLHKISEASSWGTTAPYTTSTNLFSAELMLKPLRLLL